MSSDEEQSEQEGDSNSEAGDEPWRSESRDIDARGQPVNWGQWGSVDEGNIMMQPRGGRAKRHKRDDSGQGMVRH